MNQKTGQGLCLLDRREMEPAFSCIIPDLSERLRTCSGRFELELIGSVKNWDSWGLVWGGLDLVLVVLLTK